jgi:hypothetical protein
MDINFTVFQVVTPCSSERYFVHIFRDEAGTNIALGTTSTTVIFTVIAVRGSIPI